MSEMTDASISFDSQLNMCEKKLCVCGDEWEPGEYVAKVLPGVGAEPLELTHERVIRCRECLFYEPEFVYEEPHEDVHCSEFLCEPPGCKRFHSNDVEP